MLIKDWTEIIFHGSLSNEADEDVDEHEDLKPQGQYANGLLISPSDVPAYQLPGEIEDINGFLIKTRPIK
jgi:hypothetical protein